MKPIVVACGLVALGAVAMPVVKAQEGTTVTLVAQAGARGGGGGVASMRVPIESAPIKGAPYFAEVVNESVQMLPDGNRIVRKTTGRVYRDSQGRVRRESDTDPGHVRSISITDPVAGVAWSLNAETRVAWKTPFQAAGAIATKMREMSPDPMEIERRRQVEAGTRQPEAIATRPREISPDPMEIERRRQVEAGIQQAEDTLKTKVATAGGRIGGGFGGVVAFPDGKWEEKTEKLPTRQIEGVMAEGTRTTRTIPAGAIGNEQPIAIVTEQWRSPELQVLVLTRTSDPRTGDTAYRLLGITRGEPAASWFEVPGDYTVRETGIKREASSR